MLALKKIYIYVGYVTVNLDSSFANIYVNDAIWLARKGNASETLQTWEKEMELLPNC